jgi:CheY-like chemotaxis protein
MSDAAQPVLLIVDDEPLNRDLLRRVLFHDYEILEAGDAVDAQTVLEESGAVNVLVCDHIMPGPSGVDLATAVRARWPHVVTLLLTGYEDAAEITAARRSGLVHAVIAKPWVAAQLREAVVEALAEHRRRAAG